jgi:heptosyltransferase-2
MGSVRAAIPSSEIVLAANPVVSELMSPHPFCDRVIVYDKRGPHRGIRGLWKFCRLLAMERFDMAILFQNAIEAAIIVKLARIKTRAGYSTDRRGILYPCDSGNKRGAHAASYSILLEYARRVGDSPPPGKRFAFNVRVKKRAGPTVSWARENGPR